MSQLKKQKQDHMWVSEFIDENFMPINYLLLMVISKLPVLFLEMCEVKDIHSISLTSKSSWWYICNSFPGLRPTNISYHVYQHDPWRRNFSSDIPHLGIVGIKVMPCPDFNIRRFCIENGFRNDLAKLPSHVYLLIDKSGSTRQHCCTIEHGEYQGAKTNLDIMKMFVASLIEVMKQDASGPGYFNVDKVTVLTFDGEIQCHADSLRIDEIDPNILSDIISDGSTDYNKAIRNVTRRVKENKDHTSKLFVLTDCECSVDKNTLHELGKARCSNSTLFVAPGDRSTLDNIASYANSGVHKELPLDFSRETTVGEWCDIGAQFLLLDPVSCVVPHHLDGTRPVYNISGSSEGYVLESVRPVAKVNEMSSTIVSVYDITGEREVRVKMKIIKNEPDHKTFALCIHKMVVSIKQRSTELQSERSKYLNERFHLQNLEKEVSSNVSSKKLIEFQIWVLDNKDTLDPIVIKIQARFRGINARKIRDFVVQNGCTWLQANQLASESCDSFDELPPPPMFGGIPPPSMFGGIPPLQRQLGGDFPTYSGMSLHDHGLYDYRQQLSLDELKEELYYIDNTLSVLRLECIDMAKKLEEFDEDKNREDTVNLCQSLQQIRDVLITGLSLDEKIVANTLGLQYDNVDYLRGSIIFSHKKIKEHIPIPEEYACYDQVISILQPAIDLMKHYTDKYYSIIPERHYHGFDIESASMRSFNGGTVHFAPNTGFNSIARNNVFRQVSAHPLPPLGLMRQASDGMAARGPMAALRSVSGR